MGRPRKSANRGFMLVEVLVATLLFTVGILGMVNLTARALETQGDTRNRTEAAQYANEILQRIWLAVDRTSADSVTSSLAPFAHKATSGAADCAFSGTASDNDYVKDWVAKIQNATTGLPGSTAAMQQIVVNSAAGGYNTVTVTICWKTPTDVVARQHVMVSVINPNAVSNP